MERLFLTLVVTQKIDQSMARAFTNISDETVTHVNKMLIDSQRFGRGTSIWDYETNLKSYAVQ